MELMVLNEREAMEEMPMDGGAEGSGMPSRLTHDPTQGKGTTAWQRARQMQMELNARQRRN